MTSLEGVIFSARNSKLVRLCMVGALALVLLIPVAMIGFLVSERHERKDAAMEEVHQDTGQAVFLPKRLKVTGRIDSESRSRGIFSVAVYRSSLALEGEFGQPNLAELGVDPSAVQWN